MCYAQRIAVLIVYISNLQPLHEGQFCYPGALVRLVIRPYHLITVCFDICFPFMLYLRGLVGSMGLEDSKVKVFVFLGLGLSLCVLLGPMDRNLKCVLLRLLVFHRGVQGPTLWCEALGQGSGPASFQVGRSVLCLSR